MGVMMIEDHLKILKNERKKVRKLQIIIVAITITLLLLPLVLQLERGIMIASYQVVKSELRSYTIRLNLLSMIRGRHLTLSQSLDIMDAVTSQDKIPVPIILAIIEQESEFNPRAVSNKGAKGLGQLMPSVWKNSIVDPFDPVSNVRVAINHLTYLKTQLGDWRRVFRAYVAGEAHANNKGMDWYANGVMVKVERWEKVWE